MRVLIKNIAEIFGTGRSSLKNGYIIVEDENFSQVKEGDYPGNDDFDRIIDGKGCIALPGLVNTHTHAGMTLLRGYADDLPLQTWLEEKIWPFEATLSADDIYWGTMLALVEMIKTGTTTFTDMYFQMDRVARAVEKTGLRAVLTEGLIEINDGQEGLQAAREFSAGWHKRAGGRITTMLAPHAPYTCSAGYLQQIADIAEELDLPLNIHLSETRREYEESIEKQGLSPVKYLLEIGLLERPVLAAHCVYLDQADLEILAEKQVGVAYNPASNMKLGSGIAPVNRMLEMGIMVGLGSDGVSSNNNLDLIEEARLGSYLQKVNTLDPTVLNIEQLLKMLTINGARALRIEKLGLIKEGYLADFILVDIAEASTYYPHHHNLSNLFYAGSGRDVKTVFINGKPVMEDRNLLTIDQEKVYYQVERIVKNRGK